MRHRLTRFHLSLTVSTILALAILMTSSGWLRVVALALLVAVQSALSARGVMRPQWRFFGPGICRGPTSTRRVALTFDDGPDPTTTPSLLDFLARRGIPATFFCVGTRVMRHPEICQRALGEGHQLENHSLGHDRRTNLFSLDRLRQDLTAAQSALIEATGSPPRFFRPPMGLTNLRVFQVAAELHLPVVGWTIGGRDQRARDPETVVSRLLAGVSPGAILLLHDGDQDPVRLLRILEMLVDKLEAQGYQCVRLDTLLDTP